MNKVYLIGRVTKDVTTRYSQDNMTISRYTLAVDRKGKDAGADFITCVAFGKAGEFAEKYLHKGTKIAICGHIQTGSYEKDGHKVYTTDVIVDEHEFVERKAEAPEPVPSTDADGFMSIPVGTGDDLPFN